MANLTVNNFNDFNSSVSFADELRRYKDPSNIRDSVDVTEAISQDKTTQDLVDSVNFADDLRKLKTPTQVKDGVDKANKSIESVESIAALRNIDAVYDGQQFNVLGHTRNGVGGGVFYYDASDSSSNDNNGTVIINVSGKRYKRKVNTFVTPEMFGAVGDDIEDDYLPLKNCNLSEYSDIRYSDKTYYTSNTVPFPSRKKFRGVKGKTVIRCDAANKPVGASQSYISAEGVSPTGYLDIDGFIFEGEIETVEGQIAFVLRDFYSKIGSNCLFRNTRGGGFHILTSNDIGDVISGTLVENNIKGIQTRNVGGIAVLLGEANNNKVTDGYFTDGIIASNGTYATQAILCGSAAGWNITGFHTYGAELSAPVDIKNCFNTKVDGYIESFTDVGAAINVQRNAEVSLRIKTTNGVLNNAEAVAVTRSGSYPDANIKIDLNLNHQNGDVDISGVSIKQNEIDSEVNVTLSGTYKDRVTKIKNNNLNVFKNTRNSNMHVRGRIEDNFQDRNSFTYEGNIVGYCSTSNKIINAFSHDIKLPIMRDFKKIIIDISVLGNKFDNGAVLDASYVAKVFVSAKQNGTNNWVANTLDVVTASGFLVAPSVSITQVSDNEAFLTVSGEFQSSDTTGVISALIPAPQTPVQFS